MTTAAEQPCAPRRLSTHIGGLFGKSFEVELSHDILTYTAYDPGRVVAERSKFKPSAAQWCEFRRLLDGIHLWNWQAAYESATLDGTQWRLDIAYSDKALEVWGSNNYPDAHGAPSGQIEPTETFNRHLHAVSRLVGNKEFR